MNSATTMTKTKINTPNQGIQGAMAGTTVMVKVADAVSFPNVAKTSAVKFCGAAAGVASTVS